MNEHTTPEITDTDLYTGTEEIETEETVLEDIVRQIVGNEESYTAYKVAESINKVFKATATDKQIPTQMMYQYTRNGMIAKGKKGSGKDVRYTNDEVVTFVLKYTRKYI